MTISAPAERLLRQIGSIAEQRGVSAYAVGGCVRDWVLGLSRMVDIDVTVEGNGIELARASAKALGGRVQEHALFGTATISLPGFVRRMDLATCRRETYLKPAAYPTVTAGTLHDDLFRRDFTINAMALAIDRERFGTLIDLFRGEDDLQARCLRVLHDRSFLDDPSRVLRGIRFAQRFGLQWEPHTEALAREAVASGALGWLNAGRLHKELERMLKEPDPKACLEQMAIWLSHGRRGSVA